MAYVKLPPPSVDVLLDQIVEWFARNLSAKITLRIDYKNQTHTTMEYDARRL